MFLVLGGGVVGVVIMCDVVVCFGIVGVFDWVYLGVVEEVGDGCVDYGCDG